jgi:hypothetical protein
MQKGKYSSFFQELKSVRIREGALPEMLKGMSMEEIGANFDAKGIVFDGYIKDYLLVFGNSPSDGGGDSIFFSMPDVLECYEMANKEGLWEQLANCDGGIRERYPHLEHPEPMVLYYYTIGSVYIIAVKGIENSVLYYYWGNNDLMDGGDFTFTTTLRMELFFGVNSRIHSKRPGLSNTNWVSTLCKKLFIFFVG